MNRKQKAWIAGMFISMAIMAAWLPNYLETAKPNYLLFVIVEILLLAFSAFCLFMCDRTYKK